MRKRMGTFTIIAVAAALIALFSCPVAAKVTGVCSDCHTMHNSQGGATIYAEGPYETLLVNGCVGCHTAPAGVQNDGTNTIPYVNQATEPTFIGQANPNTLSGGSFYWVATAGGGEDAKGHNVLGISERDTIAYAPGGGTRGCASTCHETLAEEQDIIPDLGTGCEGCHLSVGHHADDGAYAGGAKHVTSAPWYRFLSAHPTAVGSLGVEGIEHEKWNYGATASLHNEYLGKPDVEMDKKANFFALGNTVTAFCCGCHGDFHDENEEEDGSGNWIRHPADHEIPDSGEYASAFGASGGTGTYDPDVPVARPDLSSGTPSGTVTLGPGGDMVMCLSCHVAHGSPYDDMLRWDYNGMIADGGGADGTGCFVCHTKKDD